MSREIRLVGFAILVAAVAIAQRSPGSSGGTAGGTGGGVTTGGGGATSTSSTRNTTTTTPSTTDTQSQQQRPIFVSGQVIADDGIAPTERVAIERVCSGGTYREGYTDSKGYFSFQIGANLGVFADASTETPSMFGGSSLSQGTSPMLSGNNSNMVVNSLWSCELRASLPGYHSESVSLASRRSMDNPDVGVIVITRMMKVDGYTTSATIALAPKDAKKAYEKGLGFAKKSKPDEAQAEFLHAVDIDPKHAGAWFELGKVYEQRNHAGEARDAYQKAIAADGNFVNPYERLYLLALHDGKWADAADISDKVTRLNPYEFPSAYYFNALANINLQKWDAAEKSAREAAKIRGTRAMPKSLFLLGLVQANKGDLPGSVATLHSYLQTGPDSGDKERAQKLLGQVEQNLAAQNQAPKAQQ
jgi:tetratricopeptide (TPR) repeat protein